MKKNLIMGLMVIVTVFACGMIAIAADKSAEQPDKGKRANKCEEKAAKVSPEARAVTDLDLAERLADYGKRTQNPLALTVSAQIMKNTPLKEEKAIKTDEGKNENKGSFNTPEKLLEQAKKMAEGNGNLAALIDKESKIVGQKGTLYGLNMISAKVSPGITDSYTIEFRANERAEVLLKGDGNCDLDLYVYDENGGIIKSDTDSTDQCCLGWLPLWTGPFNIKIENVNCDVHAEYRLIHN